MGKATLHFLIKVGDLHGAELSDYRIISKSCRLPFRSVTWVVDNVAVIGMGETSEGTRRSAPSRGLLGSLGNSQPVVQGWAVPGLRDREPFRTIGNASAPKHEIRTTLRLGSAP